MTKISKTELQYESEPLRHPFGFKGGSISELWQVVAGLEGASGERGLGLGLQSVLWSDAGVFAANGDAAGNRMMFSVTDFALREIRGAEFGSPTEMLREVFPKAYEFGRKETGREDLRQTFALNALVRFMKQREALPAAA